LHAELVADSVEGATNSLNRNSAAMVFLANNNNVPGSVSVPAKQVVVLVVVVVMMRMTVLSWMH
jgi:hypothetical protein